MKEKRNDSWSLFCGTDARAGAMEMNDVTYRGRELSAGLKGTASLSTGALILPPSIGPSHEQTPGGSCNRIPELYGNIFSPR